MPNAKINQLVEEHLRLVEHHVREVSRRIPTHVSRDDLASAGREALVLAAQSYRPETGVPFASYASIRVRGALMDELRATDSVSRSIRAALRDIEQVSTKIAAETGHVPNRKTIAEALGVTEKEIEQVQLEAGRRTVSIQNSADGESLDLPDYADSPEDVVIREEQFLFLRAAIQALPVRTRVVVEKTYLGNAPLEQVARDLNLTQSRISQLRADALTLLKIGLDVAANPNLVEKMSRRGVVAKRRVEYAQNVLRHLANTGGMADRRAGSTKPRNPRD